METITTRPLLAIVGETASGKSQLGMQLAEQFGGEIIAADAWTVYKRFDIGTAKASLQDRARIIHHGIDVFEPTQRCNAAEFKMIADQAIDTISCRGSLPLLVGGTGLYIDSILFDYEFRAKADLQLRQKLTAMTNEQLQAEATSRGLDMAGVDMANNRRIIRHIESQGITVDKKPQRENTLVIGVAVPRNELESRINLRIESMFADGLENEVRAIVKEYGWDVAPMQAIGYREFREYLEGRQTLYETKAAIIKNTRQLAKKQRTWFRRNKSIQWVKTNQQAVELVTTFLNNYRR